MRRFTSLTLVETPNEHGGFDREVLTDGFRTGHLCVDEVLGCVASFLYGNSANVPQFMRADLVHARDQRRHGNKLDERDIAALQAAGESLERCQACEGRGNKLHDDSTILGGWEKCQSCDGKGWHP